MTFGEHDAAVYLRDNSELRRAVGVSDHVELTPRFLGEGEHNRNFLFSAPGDAGERKLVLRVNVEPQSFHDNQVAYEFAALEALEPSGCVPEPVYLDDGCVAPAEGAMIIGFCEGDELDFDRLRPGDLRCAAQLMADIHAVPVPQDCTLFQPEDPLRELFGECLARFEVYRRSLAEDARISSWADRFTKIAGDALDEARPPFGDACIVNTETLPSHFLIPDAAASMAAAHEGPGRFCAKPGSFIDWERPIIGEAAQDVAYFTSPTTTFWDSEFLFPASDVDAFLEDYWQAVDGRFDSASFESRFHAWRMVTALRSVSWCCRALAVGVATEKARRKLPVYLSDDFMTLLADECFVA